MYSIILFAAAVGLLGTAVPAEAQTANWAYAAVASSEYGGSVRVDDPSGELPVSPGGSTSQCTSEAQGVVDILLEPDDLVEQALFLAWFVVRDIAGVPLPGDPPDVPDVDGPDVELPVDACTPAIGVNGMDGGNWSAEKATGEPDTYPSCGDISTAWAPRSSGPDPESITLLYQAVSNAQQIDIYETNIGGFVTEVIVHTADGSSESVFSGPDSTLCPGILSIPLSGNSTVVGVEIHTQKPGWEEIDAVAVIN